MYIQEVISYKDSWAICNSKYNNELHEVLDVLGYFLNGNVKLDSDESHYSRRYYEKALCDLGWELIERNRYSLDGRRINLGGLGPTKNGVSAQLHMGMPDSLGRWLFQQCTLAIKNQIISMPILFVPVKEYASRMENKFISRMPYEMFRDQLQMLSPLTYSYPFLIIGYSDQSLMYEPNAIELEEDINSEEVNHAIDRCIEFPLEYHQAGLGILNFFGTYLREQYPNEAAAVKIEQHGLKVRLIITTEGGRTETIEKALHEYELIVTGQEPPEKFTKSDKLVLELKNELRFAQLRVETQQDLLSMQNAKIDKLLDIVGAGLANKHPITIDFKPVVSATNNVQINTDVSLALSEIAELKELLPQVSDAHTALSELENSLEAIEKENNPEVVRKSSAMNKFRRVLDKFEEDGSTLKKAMDATESGWELFKNLAGKYNKIAEWCGLPQVPSMFT